MDTQIFVTHFTPWAGLIGGVLIGLASGLLYVALGHIAGISGALARLVAPARSERIEAGLFVLGLLAGGAIYAGLRPGVFQVHVPLGWAGMAVAGFLVGVGTRLGHGCTSGHGICGNARFSPRSLVATLVFVAVGIVTATLIHSVL